MKSFERPFQVMVVMRLSTELSRVVHRAKGWSPLTEAWR
jgi:hypothetical protein